MGRNRHVSEGKEGEQEKQEDADESKVAKICASTQLCGRKKLNEQKKRTGEGKTNQVQINHRIIQKSKNTD